MEEDDMVKSRVGKYPRTETKERKGCKPEELIGGCQGLRSPGMHRSKGFYPLHVLRTSI